MSLQGSLYLRISTSKKSGNRFACIICDLGYTVKYLTFHGPDICELLDISPKELKEMKEGDYLIEV